MSALKHLALCRPRRVFDKDRPDGSGSAYGRRAVQLSHAVHAPPLQTVLDATALKLISPKQLHSNCIVTPHAGEFLFLFKQKPTKKNLKELSKKLGCIIVLKGKTDLIADNGKIYYNYTGNQGMTKGGTGDILSGMIAAFACKNPLLLSCLAACYLNGFAADLLKKEKGLLYNAKDLLEKIPEAKKKLE